MASGEQSAAANFDPMFNFSRYCKDFLAICRYIIQNSSQSDIPSQLLNDIQHILIPQTEMLEFIASNTANPNEEQRRTISTFISRVQREYQRICSQYQSYIQSKISGNPQIYDSFIRLALAQGAQPTEITAPPQSTPATTFEDLPSTDDQTWIERVWEKACEAISVLLQWFQYICRTITGSATV